MARLLLQNVILREGYLMDVRERRNMRRIARYADRALSMSPKRHGSSCKFGTTVVGSTWPALDSAFNILVMQCDTSGLQNQNSNWLKICSRLYTLSFERQSADTIAVLLMGAQSVRSLKINNCNMHYIKSDLFKDLEKLRRLDLSHNTLYYMEPGALSKQYWLLQLDLSHNSWPYLDTIQFAVDSMPHHRLSWISLANNHLLKLCNDEQKGAHGIFRRDNRALAKQISLRSTNTTKMCPMTDLSHLDLYDNGIKEFEFQHVKGMKSIEIDLRSNPLRVFHFNKEDYMELSKDTNLTLWMDSLLDCSCHHGWLARAMRNISRAKINGARCSSGINLTSVPIEDIECDRYTCATCVCRRQWSDGTVTALCQELHEIPKIEGLTTLNAHNNRIKALKAEDFPVTLRELNISKNLVERVNAMTAAALFSVPERKVWLAGNPIACDCNNWPFIEAIQEHYAQVSDYYDLRCHFENGDEHPLWNVTVDALCEELLTSTGELVLALSVGGALVILAMLTIAIALYCRYEREIKVWLYARGYCLCCVQEEELDADRPYDAFLSFSHADEPLVVDELLAGLENGDRRYRICVHYRDWIVGDFIPAQIARSVDLSRRTIIVLSRNFVQSVWGLLEFRAAHVSALSD